MENQLSAIGRQAAWVSIILDNLHGATRQVEAMYNGGRNLYVRSLIDNNTLGYYYFSMDGRLKSWRRESF